MTKGLCIIYLGELKLLREQVESLHGEKNFTQLKIDTLSQENEQLKSKLNQFNTVEEELAKANLLGDFFI